MIDSGSIIEAILFDYDGAVVHSGPLVFEYQDMVCRKRGFRPPFSSYSEWRDQVFDPFPDWYDHMGFNWETEKDWLQKEFKEFFNHVNIPFQEGITECWEGLKARGFKIAIASSNLEELIHKKLCQEGMRGLIDAIAGFGNGCRAKPYPDVLVKIAGDLKVPSGSGLYVGDMPCDKEAACAVGMPFVPVPWGYKDLAFWQKNHDGFIPKNCAELQEYIFQIARISKPAPIVSPTG